MSEDFALEPVFAAIHAVDAEGLRRALLRKPDLEGTDSQGRTPLLRAASHGAPELIRLLLAAGANPEGRLKEKSQGPSVRMLGLPEGALSAQLDEALENAPEEAKLFYEKLQALAGPPPSQDEDEEIFELEEDEEIFEMEEDGIPEPETSESTPLNAAVVACDAESVRLLLAAGAAPNPEPLWEITPPLVLAASRGLATIVLLLLEAGAKPNRGFSETPLQEAASAGHTEVCRLLLDAGAGVDLGDEDGITPLILAATQGRLDTVRLLLESGADPCVWEEGETALLSAARNGHQAVYDLLFPLVSAEIQKRGPKELKAGLKRKERESHEGPEQLIEAAMLGHLDKVKAGIAAGVDVNAIGSNGFSALMYAAFYGHMAVIEALLEAGANPDVACEEGVEEPGRTALMLAAGSFFTRDREGVLRRLAAAGANLNLQDNEGHTALMVAIFSGTGYTASVRTLLELGARTHLRNQEGKTALMLAQQAGIEPIIELLQRSGPASPGWGRPTI